MHKFNQEVSDYIRNAPEVQKAIMEQLRILIHESVDNVEEEFKWKRPVFRTNKDFAYLQSNKHHVNFGFTRNIDQLVDPENKLEGTGKTMRHLKVKDVQDLNLKTIESWLISVTQG